MLAFDTKTLSPLIAQAQIADTLYTILPPKLKRRVLVYTDSKYSAMNNEIIEKNYTGKREEFNGIKLLEDVHKSTAKELIDLKRKKLIAMGVDIDNISYEMREKYYREVSILDGEVEEEGQTRIRPTVDEGQINQLIKQNVADF
jgi:hypothetical protein